MMGDFLMVIFEAIIFVIAIVLGWFGVVLGAGLLNIVLRASGAVSRPIVDIADAIRDVLEETKEYIKKSMKNRSEKWEFVIDNFGLLFVTLVLIIYLIVKFIMFFQAHGWNDFFEMCGESTPVITLMGFVFGDGDRVITWQTVVEVCITTMLAVMFARRAKTAFGGYALIFDMLYFIAAAFLGEFVKNAVDVVVGWAQNAYEFFYGFFFAENAFSSISFSDVLLFLPVLIGSVLMLYIGIVAIILVIKEYLTALLLGSGFLALIFGAQIITDVIQLFTHSDNHSVPVFLIYVFCILPSVFRVVLGEHAISALFLSLKNVKSWFEELMESYKNYETEEEEKDRWEDYLDTVSDN